MNTFANSSSHRPPSASLPDAPSIPPPAPAIPLDEAAGLFAGEGAWHFPGVPSLGLPPLQVADCGHGVTLVAPPYGCATCLPTSVGMAATWDPALIEEAGALLGRESLAKGLGMLLAPMINLHRLPCGGRNYESFSEDPVLAGRMAAALVRGIQSEGVSACLKHLACNNQQAAQKTTSAEVDPRTLRELYLKPFAIVIREAAPWAVMTSYNPVNGEHPSDSRRWLEDILRGELGFDGLVVSDWNAVAADTALASGLDIEMPGPGKFLNKAAVLRALAEGLLTEDEIRRRARRVIRLHEQTLPARRSSSGELDTPRHRDLARRVAESSAVLLQNRDRALPLDPAREKIKRLAVVGPNAAIARLGGGGSASVLPFISVSPLEGIAARAAREGIEVVHAEGCPLGDEPPVVPASALPGSLRTEYFDVEAFAAGGPPAAVQTHPQVNFSWGWAAPAEGVPRHLYAIRWTGRLRLPDAVSGPVRLSVHTWEGVARVRIDGQPLLDAWSAWDPNQFEDRFTHRHHSALLDPAALDDRREVAIEIEYRKTGARAGIRLGWELPGAPDPIDEAERLAASADAVVICAGLSNMYEGGNCDRAAHSMPGRQEELIRRVAARNPRAIVVLNNGTPVSFRGWRDSAAAILEMFYPGQSGGEALARILFGDTNPSGRLPDTHPASWDDVLALRHYPGDGKIVRYGEGLLVGYRDADARGLAPAFPFGYGLSYTTFTQSAPRLSADTLAAGETATVTVTVANTGDREGAEVVQLYLGPRDLPPGRPPRALADFAKVRLAPGERRAVELTVRHEDLLTYDPAAAAWRVEFADWLVSTGPHSRALQSTPLAASAET